MVLVPLFEFFKLEYLIIIIVIDVNEARGVVVIYEAIVELVEYVRIIGFVVFFLRGGRRFELFIVPVVKALHGGE